MMFFWPNIFCGKMQGSTDRGHVGPLLGVLCTEECRQERKLIVCLRESHWHWARTPLRGLRDNHITDF